MVPKKVLIIAGSDPSGGAGMQADIATLQDFGVPAIFAVTAITAQNDDRVLEIHPTPADVLTQQLSAACKGQTLGAIKIGMVATGANVRALIWFLQNLSGTHLVIDPVLHSSSGASLLENKAFPLYRQQLLPLATVVTPNLLEAGALAKMQVASVDQMQRAAQIIYQDLFALRGGKLNAKPLIVIVKGGHLKNDAIDVLYDGHDSLEFKADRIPGRSPRGTGCRFASAIAAGLALGQTLTQSVSAAKKYLTGYISGQSV